MISVNDSLFPEDAIGMKEQIKLTFNDQGQPMQLVTRIYRMKDGTERKVVTTEEI